MSTSSIKKYDIVLLGATGFTGSLTAEYLLQAQGRETFSLALAGRSLKKLNILKRRLKAFGLDCTHVSLLKVDVEQQHSIDKMAAQARVVMSAVGPYVQYGEPVVRACVSQGADYVDLSGEPEFVDFVRRKFHAEAQAKGLRIVNCCGFDSIPHDLGVLFAVRAMAQHLATQGQGRTLQKETLKVQGFVSASADYSGGTWHSAVSAMGRYRKYLRDQRYWKKQAATAYPHSNRVVRALAMDARYRPELQAWTLPFPSIDPQIVLRSAEAFSDYGARFEYGHNIAFKHLPKAFVAAATVGGVFALAQLRTTRKWLLGLKDAGQGPDGDTRQDAWFKVVIQVQTSQHFLQAEVSGGDPGYGETAKMLAESALCLAFDTPKHSHTGVITPAMAMGENLIHRLQRAGISFTVVEAR